MTSMFNQQTSKVSNVFTLFKLYKYVNKYFKISFLEFSEFTHIFQNLNSVKFNYTNVLIFFLVYTRLDYTTCKLQPVIKNYSTLYFFNSIVSNLTNSYIVRYNKTTTQIVNFLTSAFIIRFSSTTASKYLKTTYLPLLEILFLRKSKVFNKGRYSRNRQFYRTGVYWCLYINIIAIVGLYFWFYRFVMNFGYLWWLLYISLVSFALTKSFHYDVVLPHKLVKSVMNDLLFFSLILNELINLINSTLVNNLVSLFTDSFSKLSKIIHSYSTLQVWFIKGLVSGLYFQNNSTLFFWRFNNINYYIHSITLNYNKVFLDSKKHKLFEEFTSMLLK